MQFGSWFPPGRLFALALMLGGPLAADSFAAAPPRASAPAPTTAEAERRAALRAEASESRIAAISALTQLIRDTDCADSDPRCAEMRLRLASLLVERAQEEQLTAVEELDARILRCEATPGCDPTALSLDNQQARATWESAARLYELVLNRWPEYSRADDASYGLAEVLFELGRPEEAATALSRMLRAHPDSAHAAMAWLRLGEHWFDSGNAAKALGAYQRALTFPELELRAYARYKLAWCLWNVGEVEPAIAALREVLGEATLDSRVNDDALRDLVMFYVQRGDPQEAVAWAQRLPPARSRLVLAELATGYAARGESRVAVLLWRGLIAEAPLAPEAWRYQADLLQALRGSGSTTELLAELDRALRTYGPGSAWARAHSAEPALLTEATAGLESNLRTLALDQHTLGRKLRSGPAATAALTAANQAYAAWIKHFAADDPHAAEVRYSFAELLYDTRQYAEAYDQYMAVVALDPQGPRAMFCAEAAVHAARKALDPNVGDTRGTTATPLAPSEQRLLAALDQYTALYPEGPRVRASLLESARLLYARNHFADASDRFRKVIALDPGSSEAEDAAELILDSFALVEDWPRLREAARALREQPGLGSASFDRRTEDIEIAAAMRQIEAERLANTRPGDPSADRIAGEQLYALYVTLPNTARSELSLHNATVYLHAGGATAMELSAREELIRRFPSSPRLPEQCAALGFAYESLADFEAAAGWYEKLATIAPGHTSAPAALWSAALFREALGQPDRAMQDLRALSGLDGAPAELQRSATLSLGRLASHHGRTAEAASLYLGFFSDPPEGATLDELLTAQLEYGLLMPALGKGHEQAAHWDRMMARFLAGRAAGEPMERGPALVAQAARLRAAPSFEAFMAMNLDGPARADRELSPRQAEALLVKQLQAKTAALAEVERQQAWIVNLGDGEAGIAALTTLGLAYEGMAQSFLSSWIPPHLTDEQREIYVQRLQDRAWPLQQRAADAWRKALDKGFELSIYNADTLVAARGLARVRPEAWSPVLEALEERPILASAVTTVGFETTP